MTGSESTAACPPSFEGSVELHGGGGFDWLVVTGTSAADEVVVTATEVRVNNLSVFYGNFEKLHVQAAGGDNRASAAGLLNASLTLSDGRGNEISVVGAGGDALFGDSGEEIVVVGIASADLAAVQTEWTSGLNYWQGISMLRDQITSEDGGARDQLFGWLGRDWFLFNSLDIASDRFFREAVN